MNEQHCPGILFFYMIRTSKRLGPATRGGRVLPGYPEEVKEKVALYCWTVIAHGRAVNVAPLEYNYDSETEWL